MPSEMIGSVIPQSNQITIDARYCRSTRNAERMSSAYCSRHVATVRAALALTILPFAERDADHLFDGRILNREIRHREIRKQTRASRSRSLARHLERNTRRRVMRNGAVLREPRSRHRLREHELDALYRCDARDQRGELAVVEQPAAIDDQHARCQRRDVRHVVRREQNGRTMSLAIRPEAVSYTHLRAHE